MAKRVYHVEYSKDDRKWRVRLTNSNRASAVKDTKEKAVKEAKRLGNQRGAEVYIYTQDGRQQEVLNYAATDRAANC